MGAILHVECPGCGRYGRDLAWGEGMSWYWRFFEHRLFHCPKCERLATAPVLRRDKDLKTALTDAPHEWGDGHQLSLAELAHALMDARRWPRCGAHCGGRYQGSIEAHPEHGHPTGCPACGAALAIEVVGRWD